MSQETILRKIPEDMQPWECNVNGVKYVYPAGTEQNVPAEVAAIIDAYWDKQDVDYPETGISFNDLRDRPFYESTEVLFDKRVEILSEQHTIEGALPISDGDLVKVTWNGVEYECTAGPGNGGLAFFGNPAVMGGQDNGIPFMMATGTFEGEAMFGIMAPSFIGKTVSVKVEVPVVKTIDPKFLPGGGKVTLYFDHPYLNKSADLGESTRPSKAEVFEYAKNGGFVVAAPDGSEYYFPVSVGTGGENGDHAAVVVFHDGSTFNFYSKEYVEGGGVEN